MKNHTQPKVAILLCTYQSQEFLKEQLDSFSHQTYSKMGLYVSDDGSEDETRSILEAYQLKLPENIVDFFIQSGPQQGFAANFLSLICNAEIQADYYAYADHDDIWEPDKLERAVDWLHTQPKNIPALYCSRTRLVDAKNQEIGLSPLYTRPPSFSNALMQNIGSGNTMVFNRPACNLLRIAGKNIKIVAHDWWTYILVTGCGGRVKFDPYPSLRYRQHESNAIGMNFSWSARLKRIRMLWQGRLQNWNNQHIQALEPLRSYLLPENRRTLDLFITVRHRWLLPRLLGFYRSGIYRQNLLGNIGLIFAAIFKRI